MAFVSEQRRRALLILKLGRQLRQARRLLREKLADSDCQTAAVQADVACQTETATGRDVGCQTDVEPFQRPRLRDISGVVLKRTATDGKRHKK